MDTCPITAQSLEQYYHINGVQLERHYKEHLSNYRYWEQKNHACDWLFFPESMGIHLKSLSNGELYTLVTNKAAKGRKGALIAIVARTKVQEVCAVLDKIPEKQLNKVEEVTLDISDSMGSIVRHCFSFAQRVIDRFHVQRLAFDAIQQMRIAH